MNGNRAAAILKQNAVTETHVIRTWWFKKELPIKREVVDIRKIIGGNYAYDLVIMFIWREIKTRLMAADNNHDCMDVDTGYRYVFLITFLFLLLSLLLFIFFSNLR